MAAPRAIPRSSCEPMAAQHAIPEAPRLFSIEATEKSAHTNTSAHRNTAEDKLPAVWLSHNLLDHTTLPAYQPRHNQTGYN